MKTKGEIDMKNILTEMLIFCLLLTGIAACSKDEDTTVSSTCSYDDEGILMEVMASAPSNEETIDTLIITVSSSYEDLGTDAETFAEYEDTFESLIMEIFLESFAVEEDALSAEMTYDDDGFEMTFTFSSEAIEEISEGEETTIEVFSSSFEEAGYTCE